MTDDQDDQRPEHAHPTMTENTDATETENTDEYEKETVRRLGERGSTILEQEQKKTDLESMDEQVDRTEFSFCTCGAPHTVIEEIYRCCSCERTACNKCHIEIRRYNYCPECVQHEYGLDKTAFKVLYLLDKQMLTPDDLIRTETVGDEVISVTIDDAAETLIEEDYLRSDADTPANSLGNVDPDNVLSTRGKEALHAGEELFGNDPDVEELQEHVRIKTVSEDG